MDRMKKLLAGIILAGASAFGLEAIAAEDGKAIDGNARQESPVKRNKNSFSYVDFCAVALGSVLGVLVSGTKPVRRAADYVVECAGRAALNGNSNPVNCNWDYD